MKRLKDPDPILRQEAALTLSQIGPDSSTAVESLLPLLDDPVRTVQLAAAFTISSLAARLLTLDFIQQERTEWVQGTSRSLKTWCV